MIEFILNTIDAEASLLSASSSKLFVALFFTCTILFVSFFFVKSQSKDDVKKEPCKMEKIAFAHLKDENLKYLQTIHDDATIATMVLRRLVHGVLNKRAHYGNIQKALTKYTLPKNLSEDLAKKYGGEPPSTWEDALQRLRDIADSSENLWKMILEHPMTAYIPVQCQKCCWVVPDETTPGNSDEDVGIREEDPLPDELPFVRSGWFRGPRAAKVFVLTCKKCGAASRWFRSANSEIILNPNRWGRLCGEQEDLRQALAEHLNLQLRKVKPLDWDHIWSELQLEDGSWHVFDGLGRNHAARIDENIGAWSRVLAIGTESKYCEDVTEEYLRCKCDGGRADDKHKSEMQRYRKTVTNARTDSTGASMQAKTLHGFILENAGFTDKDITAIMRRAAEDHGTKNWWQF